MSLATLAAAAVLTARVIASGPITALEGTALEEQFFVDPFNVFLVALTAFVAFTTSLFSRPYMRTEEHDGRLTRGRLRLYHSMFQLFTFTMLLVLTTNNLGVMWVVQMTLQIAVIFRINLSDFRFSGILD